MDKWLAELPIVTRSYLLASVVVTLATTLGVVSPSNFMLPPRLCDWWQLWKVAGSCVYSGGFSIGFLFHCYVLTTSSQRLEGLFNTTIGYCWYIVGSLILLLGPFWLMGHPLPSQGLFSVIIFTSCRSNPSAVMNFMFFNIQIQALYFPLLLTAFHVVIGSSPFPDIAGYIVGHLYVYHCVLRHQKGTFLPLADYYEVPKIFLKLDSYFKKRQLGDGPLPWGRR
eukprot:TRINITY_DN2391_c0_g2_i2.p1 TRINITY_DN2391_c0_g2~~TRINITY_DN2391_c0_g2_i2.p1  ORF type:complete len:236 (+),score=17.74 TRINITY_DN2391_c0_g2_i2:37-708(+)